MKAMKLATMTLAAVAAVAALCLGFVPPVSAGVPLEATILGGVQGLTENDTALKDDFVNIPVAASLAWRASSIFAVESEVAWVIPVRNTAKVGLAGDQKLKNPDVLSYQANLRAEWPRGAAISPYATAGLGAMTFLSANETERYPRLSESQTVFAMNFGFGAAWPVSRSLSLRGDLREFVAFPQNDTPGLSDGTDADPIWMPRASCGLTYRF